MYGSSRSLSGKSRNRTFPENIYRIIIYQDDIEKVKKPVCGYTRYYNKYR